MANPSVIDQFRSLSEQMSPGKKIAVVVLMAATISGLIMVMVWAGQPEYQVLYSELAVEDSGAIYDYLKTQKVPFKVSANGHAILVPGEQVYELRLELAARGIPQGGATGFELFDNSKLGMTEFMQNVNFQRALQGELSRTINRFDEVASSRVHIVLPAKSLFKEDEQPATASVTLQLKPGKTLSQRQVQGIVHLVSSSIAGLHPERVTLLDNRGNILAGAGEQDPASQISTDQLAFQDKLERSMEQRVKTMLEKALGPNKAIVRVSASIDFRQQEKTEERYLSDNRVVRSEKLLNENSGSSDPIAAGVPGVVPNMTQRSISSPALKSSNGYQKADRTVNYEIGRVTSHTVEPYAKVIRLSVAAMVDGVYRAVTDKTGTVAYKYIPRSQDEMAKLTAIIKGAVNYDAQRGDTLEVANISFNAPPMSEEEAAAPDGIGNTLRQLAPVFKYGSVALAMILAFFFIFRPMIKWLTATPHGGHVEMLKQLPMTVSELENKMGGGSARDEAIALLESDKTGSLGLMKQWLKEA